MRHWKLSWGDSWWEVRPGDLVQAPKLILFRIPDQEVFRAGNSCMVVLAVIPKDDSHYHDSKTKQIMTLTEYVLLARHGIYRIETY
jgi:hypothetical protein